MNKNKKHHSAMAVHDAQLEFGDEKLFHGGGCPENVLKRSDGHCAGKISREGVNFTAKMFRGCPERIGRMFIKSITS